jgi:DNA-binding CsgD family transcriptional regulator
MVMTLDLVGRHREVARLSSLVDRATGGGSALVVLGDPGVGKTVLRRAAGRRARDAGFRVVETTGVESEHGLPYAGLQQLLGPFLDLAGHLPQVQRRALLAALGGASGNTPEPFLVALAGLNLLSEAAAERPVLVAVDDMQWLDGPTHDALTFIARRVARDPIVVVGTDRRGHPGPYVEAGLDVLDIGVLDEDSSRALLARTAPDLRPSDRERILRAALGNPLALVELPTAWRAAPDPAADPYLPLTARLESAFSGRLGGLPDLTRDAVLTAAVDDGDELAEILAATTILAAQEADATRLEPAVAAGLLDFDELRVRFRHPLVRSGVLQAEPLVRRQQAHTALAAVLDDEPYRRTWHRAHTVVEADNELADELEAVHSTALARGSAPSAIWLLERSARLTTDPAKRVRRLLTAAEHAFGLGRSDMVDRLLREAARWPLSDLDQARIAWLREIFNDGVPGDAVRVFDLCDAAGRAVGAGDTDLALDLLLAAAMRCWWADTGPDARARVAKVTHEIGADADPRSTAALAVAEPVLEAATASARLSRVVLETVDDPNALRLLGMAAHASGDPARAVDLLGRAESTLRAQGRLGLLSHVVTMQVLDHVALGNWSRAAACADEGRRYARDTGQPIWDTDSLSLAAILAAARGDNERAQALAAEAEQQASSRGLNDLLTCVQLARGFGWISTGNHADGFEALRHVFDPADPAYHPSDRFHGVLWFADAAAHAGRVEEGRTVVDVLEREARVTPSPTLHIGLSFARAVFASDDEAEALFLAALRQDLVRWPWPRARLELAYGSWLRRQRRATESRSPLRAACTTLELIGALPWADLARAELRAAGARPVETADALQDLLSPQELQIALLAADGLSNKEIGERLYMSHRTVGSHLYRVFPKLAITSRSQLAARLTPRAPTAT